MKRQRGFTLLEVLIAISIVGALLVIAFGGMRVAMAAWRQGETRVEAHQHIRAVAYTLTRALGAAYPYRAAKSDSPEAVVLFDATDRRLQFVTQSPPLPETNCAGCGVEKLTTSNRWTCPDSSALTLEGNSVTGLSGASTDCNAPLPGNGASGLAGFGANASTGWWLMKNAFGCRAASANARLSCAR